MERKVKLKVVVSVLMLASMLGSSVFFVAGCGIAEALLASFINVLGAQPSDSFSQDGTIEFSLLPQDSSGNTVLGSVSQSGMQVQVKNDDGTYSDCTYVGEESETGSLYNSLVLLMDDSGSMGRTYPEEEFGTLCLSCPHDPEEKRATAAGELIKVVLQEAPESRIALMDFGPFIDEGKTATRVIQDFTSTDSELFAGLEQIDGTQEAGTPLWDSLAETIGDVDENGDEFDDILRADPSTSAETSQRYIVVLSDGDDRDSQTHTLNSVIQLAKDNNVVIHAIGLGPASAAASDPRLSVEEQITTVRNLQELAASTGGFYASVHDADALNELYGRVAKSLVDGYQKATYACKPKDLNGEERVPASGEKVEGRVNYGDGFESWSIIAP